METEKILIIVDFQRDFCNPQGSLYVKGSEEALENIKKFLEENLVKEVILTLDWHNYDDESFKVNGGQWPVHCLQYSEGAGISDELMKIIGEHELPYQIFRKGDDPTHEEYGAFEKKIQMHNSDNIMLVNHLETSMVMIKSDTEYVLCGIAGDYCVYETFKNLMKHGIKPRVFMDGMAFINQKSLWMARHSLTKDGMAFIGEKFDLYER